MSAPTPTGLTASYASGHIALHWGLQVGSYNYTILSRRINGGGWTATWKTIAWGTFSYNDTDVGSDGTFYEYEARTYYAGDYSSYSGIAGAVTPLPDPDQMDGSAVSISECDTTWRIKSVNHTGVKLYMDGALLITLGKVTHYEKTGLAEGSTHDWKVKVFNSYADSGFSNTATIKQEKRPTAPSLLVVTAISTSVISGSFKDNSSDETDFRVYGSSDGVNYSLIKTLAKNVTTFTETSLGSNVTRWYYVIAHSDAGSSAHSNVASATTFAAISQPTMLQIFPVSGTIADVIFKNNSTLEDGHKVELATGTFLPETILDGGYEVWTSPTLPTNWIAYIAGTSTLNREGTDRHSGLYCVRFDIDAGNDYSITAQYVTLTPSGAYVFSCWYKTAVGKTCAFRLRDDPAHVRLKSDGTWIADDGAGIVLPSTSGAWAQYTFAFTAHPSYSAYNLFVGHNTAYGSTAASSSIYIDDFSICGSGFAVNTTTAPVQDAARITGLTAGTAYSVRVRAFQGTAYSIYSDIVSFTTLATPATPTDLAISELQDDSMRLTWTPIAGVTGYKLKKSIAGGAYAEFISLWGSDISTYKVQGLTPGVLYGFEIAAYNGAGTSAYSGAVTSTTLLVRSPSALEKLLRKPAASLVYLLEINPLMLLSGFTQVGVTTTYQLPISADDRGIEFSSIYVNGIALTASTTLALVTATAGTFWHDYYGGILYVHLTDGSDPLGSTIAGGFWLYFCSYKRRPTPMNFNGHNYLPYFRASDVPSITQAITQLYEGNLLRSGGQIRVMNTKQAGGGYFWDSRFGRYEFRNRPLALKVGGPNFTYDQFDYYDSGLINSAEWADDALVYDFRDPLSGLSCKIPPTIFTAGETPSADSNILNQRKPFFFGQVTGSSWFVPPCIDTTRRVYLLHDGRIKSVEYVYRNATLLAAGTDYFVDYQRGRITLSRALALTILQSDTIKAQFTGQVNSADESYSSGPDQLAFGLTTWLGLTNAGLNIDSIGRTKEIVGLRNSGAGVPICIGLTSETESDDFIRMEERSLRAYSFQDSRGRVGLLVPGTTAPTSSPLIQEYMLFENNLKVKKGIDRTASAVRVYYCQDYSQAQAWSMVSLTRSMDVYLTQAKDTLPDFYTGLISSADAIDSLNEIDSALTQDPVNFICSQILFYIQPGDVVPMTRARFPGMTGTAVEQPIVIDSITKDMANRRTTGTGRIIIA